MTVCGLKKEALYLKQKRYLKNIMLVVVQNNVEPPAGIEPATYALRKRRSTN